MFPEQVPTYYVQGWGAKDLLSSIWEANKCFTMGSRDLGYSDPRQELQHKQMTTKEDNNMKVCATHARTKVPLKGDREKHSPSRDRPPITARNTQHRSKYQFDWTVNQLGWSITDHVDGLANSFVREELLPIRYTHTKAVDQQHWRPVNCRTRKGLEKGRMEGVQYLP